MQAASNLSIDGLYHGLVKLRGNTMLEAEYSTREDDATILVGYGERLAR